LIAVVWSSGALYWHLRISRALSQLHRDSRIAVNDEVGFRTTCWVPYARSRAIPYLLQHMRQAASQKDLDWFLVLGWAETDAYTAARTSDLATFSFIGTKYGKDTPTDFLRKLSQRHDDYWDRERSHYPPWWMWWNGRYRPSP
jgi:hypothetical protein